MPFVPDYLNLSFASKQDVKAFWVDVIPFKGQKGKVHGVPWLPDS